LNRLRNSTERLKLQLKRYRMFPAQFRHRTSSLRLLEDVHDRYKEVVQGCEHCQQEATLAKEQGVRLAGIQFW
jgi:hypothetical protein